MNFPLPKKCTFFVKHIRHFASDLGLSLTNDDALDITGHLWDDDFYRTLHKTVDWHCILWNREVALTGEIYSLAHSAPEALAAVLALGAEEDQELEPVEFDGSKIVVYHEGQVYATITRPAYETPRPDLLQRMETLLAPLRVSDEVGLLRRLVKLPGWTIELYNGMPLYSDQVLPVGSPRNGEWLPPLSVTYGNRLRPYKTVEDEFQAREDSVEQDRLPMWVTPSTLAKTLQTLLTERLSERPKLHQCQETLAHALGMQSWQVLVSRFEKCVFLQVAQQQVEGDADPQLKFYRSSPELLACVYGQALQMTADGSRMHISASWLSGENPSLNWRERDIDELRAELFAKAGPNPPSFALGGQAYSEASERWDEVEFALRCAANEWRSDKLFTQMGGFDDEHLCEAHKQLGLPVPSELEETNSEQP